MLTVIAVVSICLVYHSNLKNSVVIDYILVLIGCNEVAALKDHGFVADVIIDRPSCMVCGGIYIK